MIGAPPMVTSLMSGSATFLSMTEPKAILGAAPFCLVEARKEETFQRCIFSNTCCARLGSSRVGLGQERPALKSNKQQRRLGWGETYCTRRIPKGRCGGR
jgi:hypothetical protein